MGLGLEVEDSDGHFACVTIVLLLSQIFLFVLRPPISLATIDLIVALDAESSQKWRIY